MSSYRDVDLEVAKATGHWAPGSQKHPHDRSDGAFRVVQCAACGILDKPGIESCDCGSTSLQECVNPRIPAYSTQHAEAWKLITWMIQAKVIDGFSLQWGDPTGWKCMMKRGEAIAAGEGSTEAEAMAAAAILTGGFPKESK